MKFTRTLPFLAVLAFLPASSNAALLAHYSFDSGFTDASGNNNDLTIAVGTPTISTTAGEHVFGGGALDLDSTISNEEYLNLTSTITFGTGDAWSISFWGRRRPGSDDRQGMVAGNPGNTQDFIWLSNNPSQVEGLRFRSTSNQNANFDGFPDDGQFHHWVVISDGAGTISAYRDNVPQTAGSAAGDFNIISIGDSYTGTTHSMNGQIDEMYIFDEAIDSTTVSSLFTSNVIPEPGSLILLGLGGLTVLRRRR